MHEADNSLLNQDRLVVLQVGPISADNIQLMAPTTDLPSLFYFTGYVVLIRALFLVGVVSGRPVSETLFLFLCLF